MHRIKPELEKQLGRQSTWLTESWHWILKTKVLPDYDRLGMKPSALDVGCGPGFVMESLSSLLNIKGADIDEGMVSACEGKGLEAVQAPAEKLPFGDGSFDVVYCTYLLLWVRDPYEVVAEMKRVSRRWVACLAEPDFGARIDYPDRIEPLTEKIVRGIENEGGDPFIGRKLRAVFSRNGLDADMGVHPGIWSLDRLRKESEDEWRWIDMTVSPSEKTDMTQLRGSWDEAVQKGTLFQFNPTFYAVADKKR